MAISAKQLIGQYHCGSKTASECIGLLCELSLSTDPKLIVDLLPSEFIASIHEKTVDIPRAEDLILLQSSCYSGVIDLEASMRDDDLKKIRFVEGLRTWKIYFEAVELQEYEEYVRHKIEIGLRQHENGEGIPHEEVKRRFVKKFNGDGVPRIVEDNDPAGGLR